ncbi:cupin domain-containing protein [archaeon]|nr:cupin domain-containing protein [archaeon]
MKKENFTGRALSLNKLISYQKNSVVSIELAKKQAGTITLFAFDKGQGLSEHAASFDAFIQVIDGLAEVRVAGKKFRLKKGAAVILPANKPHSVHAPKKFKMLLAMIKS